MKQRQFVTFSGWFAIAGLVVAVLFGLAWQLNNHFLLLSLTGNMVLQKLTFMLWPSSLWLLAPTQGIAAVEVFLISAVVNALIYSAFGALIWLGLYKSRPFLVLSLALLVAAWWWLLNFR